MAKRLTGKEVAAALMEETSAKAAALREKGVVPTLALLRVGEKQDALAYEAAAEKRCAAAGIAVQKHLLPETVSQGDLLREIRELNGDPAVHGVLMFRPFPAHLDEIAACAALSPEKDMDGVTDGAIAGLFKGSPVGFPPCAPHACLAIADHYGIELKGKMVTVVGEGAVVGRPLTLMLLRRGATVAVTHILSRPEQTADLCRQADIIMTGAGKAGLVGASHVREGQIVIDVGINVGADGKLCGDADYAAVEPVVAAITPVPGGVGSVTTAVLAAHVVEAAERSLA